ncbi:hypothetical protein H5968_06820 [Sphaerospermopsis sp. LEGE 00249]|uniref:hypothetical protein n=1 Tax=Sphaerospermopsis sp. LEGE 00249 TaxID=1380707 RepID=UPI00164E0D73|nr:hypothetical protein [Sphaerospermopsis sp. LEGE 00249]MBC5794865.1 hypothetical protein [Sphaerospermopsis sp. LEGE 00249]
MSRESKHRFEVWSQLWLSHEDRDRIQDFFTSEIGVKPRFVVKNMHITVYHARRMLPDLKPCLENVEVFLDANDTRFMVMAPGGENPRDYLNPGRRKVGVRIHRQSIIRQVILEFRARLTKLETKRVLGARLPSSHNRNAFGARHFQPHMTLLWAGSGIDHDLTKIGVPFRKMLGTLKFDKFSIEIKDLDLTNISKDKNMIVSE